MDPDSSSLRIWIPDGVLPVGQLHVKLHKFSYCERDGAGHSHFADPPDAATPYPAARSYAETIHVPPPPVPTLSARAQRRRTTFRIVVPESANRRVSARLEPPRRRANDPLGVLTAGDDEPAAAGGRGGGGGGEAALVANDDDGEPRRRTRRQAIDDDDDDGERERRQAGGGARARAGRLAELQDSQVEIELKFEPARDEDRIRNDEAASWDLNVKEKTAAEIFAHLNAVAEDWKKRLGRVHVNWEAPFFTLVDAGAGTVTASLALPPSLGIGLASPAQLKMLGFYSLTSAKAAGRDMILQKIPFRDPPNPEDVSWIVGDTPPGYSYVAGPPAKSGIPLKPLESRVKLNPNVVRGDNLLRSYWIHHHKASADPERDDPLYIFRPRLVVNPPGYRYVVDLDRYSPPAELSGKLALLTSLTSCLTDLASELLAVRTAAYRLTGVQANRPAVQAQFDASQAGACFVMQVRFGSLALASKFGLAVANFAWDARTSKTAEPVPIDPALLTELAMQQKPTDPANLSTEDYRTLRANLANLVDGTRDKLPDLFVAGEKKRYSDWRAPFETAEREAYEARLLEEHEAAQRARKQQEEARRMLQEGAGQAEDVGRRLDAPAGGEVAAAEAGKKRGREEEEAGPAKKKEKQAEEEVPARQREAAERDPAPAREAGERDPAAEQQPPAGGQGAAPVREAGEGGQVPPAEDAPGREAGGGRGQVPPAEDAPAREAGGGRGREQGAPAEDAPVREAERAPPANVQPAEGGGGGEGNPAEREEVPPAEGQGGGEEGGGEEAPAQQEAAEGDGGGGGEEEAAEGGDGDGGGGGEEDPAEEEAGEEGGEQENDDGGDDDDVPANPRYLDRPNSEPKPPATYVHFNRDGGDPADEICKGGGAPANFPAKFFVVVEEGEREDYFFGLGDVCLGASFVESGASLDDMPCNATGFRLRNWTRGARSLDFYIFDSQTLAKYKNASNVVGYARCVVSYERLDE